ncbi:hypothetical protein Dda_1884 [Drechslerella dactyloides]|uniref:Uncharacterized protein n=1 Tax=Drechslerella dactyloides TaxID=74499 RepID=A0AAD6NL11_DREDA|nr:hypothetical protein Dda_1884 [Drechslerella dactyloides]
MTPGWAIDAGSVDGTDECVSDRCHVRWESPHRCPLVVFSSSVRSSRPSQPWALDRRLIQASPVDPVQRSIAGTHDA